jgi:hypothetical protein
MGAGTPWASAWAGGAIGIGFSPPAARAVRIGGAALPTRTGGGHGFFSGVEQARWRVPWRWGLEDGDISSFVTIFRLRFGHQDNVTEMNFLGGITE